MGKRERAKAKSVLEEEDDSQSPSKRVIFIFSDSDDEEANEDLSLKIVEKAKSRAARAAENGGDTVAVQEWKVSGGEDVVTTELVASTPSVKKKVMKIKKLKKIKKTQPEAEVEPESAAKSEAIHVNVVGDEANVSTFKDEEVVNLSEGVENADNAVLRRLLRGPRYFDPPESNWGACFRCGEDGHSAANCLSAKRKKPCFICGSVEHEVKQCIKAKDCFICNESGHRAKDCPQKFKKCSKSSEFCLRCGASGHIMSSCNNEYSPDDLKEIQCYVCKSYGHLCCANYFDSTPGEVSCYKCGQTGHTGPECRTSQSDATAVASPSLCFMCGEKGHFARECTYTKKDGQTYRGERVPSLSLCFICGDEGHFARECPDTKKVKKRDRELSTPRKKPGKVDKGQRAVKSATPEARNSRKKKKVQFKDVNYTSPRKLKRKGGWVPDDPGDYSYRYSRGDSSYGNNGNIDYSYGNNANGDYSYGNARGDYSYGNARGNYYKNADGCGWSSPVTPIRNHMVSSLNSGGYHSDFRSYKTTHTYYPAHAYSQDSAGPSQHKSSASRFGNSYNGDGMRSRHSNGDGMRSRHSWR